MIDSAVTIVVEPRDDGGIRVHSPDEPGLILSGANPSLVMGNVLKAVRMLREHRAAEAARIEEEAKRDAEFRSDGWIEWSGGPCPVPPQTMVHFRTPDEVAAIRAGRNPSLTEDPDGREASSLRWEWNEGAWDNIAAYRIVPA